jgi:signal transduction histidine kinase/ActR/RegA family two-component response regulator
MRLRSHLAVVVVLAVAPLLIFSIVILRQVSLDQRALLDQGMRDTARALSLAIDGEVKASRVTLETLAASAYLDTGDLKAFHQLCAQTIGGRQNAYVILFDPSGQQLVNSSRPFGSSLPNPLLGTRPAGTDPRYPDVPIGGAEPVKRVLEAGRPVVSNLFVSLVTRAPRISVDIPVVRADTIRYVLELSFDPGVFSQLLMDRRFPAHSVAAIVDRNGLVIARSFDPIGRVGRPLSPTLAARVAGSEEASGVGHTVEGLSVYHVLTRSPSTGWTTSFAVSQAVVSGPVNRSIALLTGGALLALILGLAAALAVGRRVSTPLSTLAGVAAAMVRGERMTLKVSGVREVVDLHGALVTANELAREAASERERRLVAEAKRAEAQTANQAKDEFLATLSHELRTPINAVYGWAHMLRAGQVAAGDRARALDAILRNAHAQVQLIDDLLDVSRIVSGKLRLDVRAVELKSVIEGALDAVRPAADGKGIRLQAVLDPGTGPLTGDPDRLQQVVWNLLANAIKFTPKDGRVQIHLQRVNSHVEIVVSDTGQGISAEMLPAIFDRFWQGQRGPTRTHGGLGLGLALVRYLVEAHGGTVTAQSSGEGEGATFIVKLPVTLARIDAASERVHPTAQTLLPTYVGPALEGLRVLVVDDDLDALDLGTAILTAARATVRTCQSVQEALTVFSDWRPDVLIADIEMPMEDGLSLIRKIRTLEPAAGGRVPAIALTAYGRTEDRVRTLSAGFSMHVPKPVNPAELVTVVASLSGREIRHAT